MRWSMLAAAALLAAGCGTARRGIPVVEERPITDRQVDRGQIVFFRHCHTCHPGGTEGIGPALNDKPLPESIIATQVRAGLGLMPAFSEEELSNQDLRAVVAYLFWLRELEPTAEAKD